ncbi:hypothetical protein VMCG_04770 [Cytospora schulzeri]|uniref:Cytochrome P450 n=1 Tax=Cytospora schulzeri TaxID=448051 RepID=A0A423WMQ6_9PEZI|nr:hypothetical protein VMCG_04770 [Valsa malicola]
MALQNVVLREAMTIEIIVTVVLGAISVYAALRSLYLLYFHPLAKYPGPRIAALSNIWYAHHWLPGRYPWAIEDALRKYGDVVRIAPNELVFFTPQAFADIYTPAQKGLEVLRKTDFQNRGANLGGIIWEEDPVKHRKVARKLLPAFSPRSVRIFEPVMHKHMDFFIERMKLAWDTSQDVAWNEETFCMRDEKDPVALDVLISFTAFATMIQVFKWFPLRSPVKYLFAPVKKLSSLAEMERTGRKSVLQRIKRRSNTPHPDLSEYILPANAEPPTEDAELPRLGSAPECYKTLTDEIRSEFANYDGINIQNTTHLHYLVACLDETLRMISTNSTGLPRYSPGAVVDGHYIPRGVPVQTSIFPLGRSPRYFHDPMHFRPERYLPSSHPLYDKVFANDAIKGLHEFSLGPRACMGQELGWAEARLFTLGYVKVTVAV